MNSCNPLPVPGCPDTRYRLIRPDKLNGTEPEKCPDELNGTELGGAEAGKAGIKLQLPLGREALRTLRAGNFCLLSGPMYTLRDAGHLRLLQEMQQQGNQLPYDLSGQTIFYAGPTPPLTTESGQELLPFAAIGPTTATRMDFAAPTLYAAGIVATIGKGRRGAAVKQACQKTGAVYFVTVGGAAAYLARCVEESEVIAYDDLGTEALRRIVVRDFPVFVGLDTEGNDIYG